MLHRNINVLYEIHVFFRIHKLSLLRNMIWRIFVFIFQERISTQLNVWLQQWCVVVVKQQRQLKRKRRGSFRQTQGFLLTYTHSHSDFAANETETFCKNQKKIEKPKREKDFSFLLSNEVLRSAICSFKSVIQKLIDNK